MNRKVRLRAPSGSRLVLTALSRTSPRHVVRNAGLPVPVISLDMLKRNKQEASRQKDLNDLDQLD